MAKLDSKKENYKGKEFKEAKKKIHAVEPNFHVLLIRRWTPNLIQTPTAKYNKTSFLTQYSYIFIFNIHNYTLLILLLLHL